MKNMTMQQDEEKMKEEAKGMSTIDLLDNFTHELACIKGMFALLQEVDFQEMSSSPVALLFEMEAKLEEIEVMVSEIGQRALKNRKGE